MRPALEGQEGRIELIVGDVELYPGLELLKAGGHTPGSQMVALQTAAGKTVLCGDIAYTFKIFAITFRAGITIWLTQSWRGAGPNHGGAA